MKVTRVVGPSEYVTSGQWRAEPSSWEMAIANRARNAIANLGMYPPREMTGPEDQQYVANARAILHLVADQLDATDAIALFRIAEPMAKTPRDPGLLERIAARSEREIAELRLPKREYTRSWYQETLRCAREYVTHLEGRLAELESAEAATESTLHGRPVGLVV